MRKGRVRVRARAVGRARVGRGGGRGGWDAIGASEIEIALETRRRTDAAGAAGAAAAGAAPKVGVAGAAPPKGCECIGKSRAQALIKKNTKVAMHHVHGACMARHANALRHPLTRRTDGYRVFDTGQDRRAAW